MGAVASDVVVHGDEDAPFSVEVHLRAAPAEIASLTGTHALVARSPERGKRARKRWFASVSVCPAVESIAPTKAISREEVTITAMRASGPGGQHVNRTASAVRVHHAPSGITVRVADERSQRDNVSAALARIARQIEARDGDRTSKARAERRLLHYRLTRGTPAFVYELDRDGHLALSDRT
ncbi:MAG: peptide chain release factor-like protein [Polyangiaceae bacterium]